MRWPVWGVRKSKMRPLRLLLPLHLCTMLTGTLAALIVGTHAAAQESKVDPKVQAVIERAIVAYKGLKAFHEKIIMKGESHPPGMIPGFTGSMEVRLQKPNKLWLKIESSEGGKRSVWQVVCDGVNLWRWSSEKNIYTKSPAPQSMAGIPVEVPTSAVDLGMLLYGKDPLKVAWPAGTAFTLGESEKLGDIAVDVVTAKIADPSSPVSTVFRMMIGQQDHLVRGYSFQGSGKHPQSGKEVSFKFEATYPLINASPTFSAKDFAFIPPPGAKLVAFDPALGKKAKK